MDLTSGQSAGAVFITDFGGKVAYNGKSGHMYQATLQCTAYSGLNDVSKVADNACIIWTVLKKIYLPFYLLLHIFRLLTRMLYPQGAQCPQPVPQAISYIIKNLKKLIAINTNL